MQIFTVPNILTFIRLALTPVFIVVALNNPIAGAIMVAILASTDFIDGYIARRFHQETQLGRILDPISDRLLTISAFIVFIITGSLPLWFVIIFGFREVLVSVGTLIIGMKNKARLDVNMSGKSSALAAMVAVPAWVLYNKQTNPTAALLPLAIAASLAAIIAGYISIYYYISAYRAFESNKTNK